MPATLDSEAPVTDDPTLRELHGELRQLRREQRETRDEVRRINGTVRDHSKDIAELKALAGMVPAGMVWRVVVGVAAVVSAATGLVVGLA